MPKASAVAVSAVPALAERLTSSGSWREATLRAYKQVRSFKKRTSFLTMGDLLVLISSCKQQACTILKNGYKYICVFRVVHVSVSM